MNNINKPLNKLFQIPCFMSNIFPPLLLRKQSQCALLRYCRPDIYVYMTKGRTCHKVCDSKVCLQQEINWRMKCQSQKWDISYRSSLFYSKLYLGHFAFTTMETNTLLPPRFHDEYVITINLFGPNLMKPQTKTRIIFWYENFEPTLFNAPSLY